MTLHKDLPYLEHILDAIESIEKSTKNIFKKKFEKDGDIREANIRRVEIIGEAVKNISESLKNKHPEIEWKKIAGTRDRVTHHYFGVDLNIIWNIIKKDLPDLKKKMLIIKKELNNSDNLT